MLYTCAREFDFLGWEMPHKTSLTLLLPAAILATSCVFYHLMRSTINALNNDDKYAPFVITRRPMHTVVSSIVKELFT
jgi:hypothetical protein